MTWRQLCLLLFYFQVPLFMMDIYRSLTEDNGVAGILKPLDEESELEALRSNPFHISTNDIKVSFT